MQDIKSYYTFTKIEPVNKGYSSDKKYYIETADGRKLLLRVADISDYDRKRAEFEMMKQVAALSVPMSQPVDFGTCDIGKSVYSLLTWCDGEDAEVVLPYLTETEQYLLGIKSGEILRLIHSIPAPKEQEEWSSRFNRIVWSATISPHFASGQLNGYFGGRPPIEFFKLLAFYISSNTLSSIYWAIPFGEKEITTMKNQARDVLSWFDNMNNPVPAWYEQP